ncbi:biopolymer transporter ExbD [Flavobacteriaceae bacterium R38]|nr:biopolymer transporter ExbD [Flavobacteriaceae bacterium R38]
MKFSRNQNQVNAGSMADIAFLLLIFFLVTTVIPNDEGIPQKLPRACENPPCEVDLHENNVFRIFINKNHEILVENELMPLGNLRKTVISFLDNNADNSCDYCSGSKLDNLSDHPKKAVISLLTDRGTAYGTFISVENELIAAYTELREAYAYRKFKTGIEYLTKDQLVEVRKAYPQVISEAETN